VSIERSDVDGVEVEDVEGVGVMVGVDVEVMSATVPTVPPTPLSSPVTAPAGIGTFVLARPARGM
jgi:hypothetical protein